MLLCGWVVVYTIGTHNVARAHAPHCAAAESDFALCLSPQDCLLTPQTEAILGLLEFGTCCLGHSTLHVHALVVWRPGQYRKVH